ncbi:MAG TPA: sigma-70 family RNA polymerase sigma factor, partial [Micromonosporaceae bacterium]
MRATSFDSHREHLLAVAYRMLGSRVEAEDAVQEAWLRYTERRPEVDDLRGWLITVVARISLDLLRSARVRRERYVGSWLPEPVVTRLPGDRSTTDPAEVAVRDEQVGLALLVVLDRLPPEQRIAFVLHDAFAVPFEAIAEALGTSTANARQLASRARVTVRTAAP